MPTVFRSQEHTHSTIDYEGLLLVLIHWVLKTFTPKTNLKFQVLLKILFLRALIGISIFYLHYIVFLFFSLYSTNQLLSSAIEIKCTLIPRKLPRIIVNAYTFLFVILCKLEL